MKAVYPNLELLELKASILLHNEFVKARCEVTSYDFVVDVFSQIWDSTCTAFDICKDGSPAIGGSAMTEAYTVVFHERSLDIYFVFVNNKFCYCVEKANSIFLDDLRSRNLKSLSGAKEAY